MDGHPGGMRAQAGYGSRNHRTPRYVALAPGRETVLCFRRMASFAEPSLFLIGCEVTPLNYAGQVEVESTHLALVKNYANPNDPRLAGESECHLVPTGHLIEEGASYLSTRTRVSGLR